MVRWVLLTRSISSPALFRWPEKGPKAFWQLLVAARALASAATTRYPPPGMMVPAGNA